VLTIGQVAAATGLTVRAVRHYHACGLLAEPPRDASGYRRYGARDVIELVRIRTLASAGVPLARIRSLLEADAQEYVEAIDRIDEDLRRRIETLEMHRRDLARLEHPERLCLPEAAVDIQARLRGLGLSEHTLAHFRDGWILVAAVSPEYLDEAVAGTHQQLDDPGYPELLLRIDAAADWSPDDPRLTALAADSIALERESAQVEATTGEPAVDPLLASFNATGSPAWGRLNELIEELSAEDS
jgi:DNA-binding transcriptional MerR regulator